MYIGAEETQQVYMLAGIHTNNRKVMTVIKNR